MDILKPAYRTYSALATDSGIVDNVSAGPRPVGKCGRDLRTHKADSIW